MYEDRNVYTSRGLPILRDSSSWFSERHIAGQAIDLLEQAGASENEANSPHLRDEDKDKNWLQAELQREQWQFAWGTEIEWWRKWFATKGLHWPEDYANRMDPHAELDRDIKAQIHTPKGTRVKLLDVGSGPATSIGKVWTGCMLNVTAVDPLAEAYHQLYTEAMVTPPIVPIALEGERLTTMFPRDTFDIVHSKNAVDHSHNAPRVVQEMIRVAREGGIVIIYVNENVAKKENNWGFHRWNFEAMPRHYSRLPQGEDTLNHADVLRMNDSTEELLAAFDVFVWNEHSYQRVADLFPHTCAHIERVVVKEGYVEYPARYITVEIRKTGTDCPP